MKIEEILKLSNLLDTPKQREYFKNVMLVLGEYFDIQPKPIIPGGRNDYFDRLQSGELFKQTKKEEADLYLSIWKSELKKLRDADIEPDGFAYLTLDILICLYIQLLRGAGERVKDGDALIYTNVKSNMYQCAVLFRSYLEIWLDYVDRQLRYIEKEQAIRRRKKTEEKEGNFVRFYNIDGKRMNESEYQEYYGGLDEVQKAEVLGHVQVEEIPLDDTKTKGE